MMDTKRVLLIVGVVVLGAALFIAGTAFGQSRWGDNSRYGWGPGHMYGWGEESDRVFDGRYGSMMGGAQGMMGGGMHGWGEEGGWFGHHSGSMMGPAMMGGWGGLADVKPLSVEEAEQAVIVFLSGLEEDNLSVGELMIFENHAYAQVVKTDSGAGAFELLVDPVNGDVYPEPGPNMMWNTEYGHMASGVVGGHMGGMMGGYGFPGQEGEPAVDEAEAVELAQTYLDEFLSGATAEEHADAFPGYYTLHVLRDGEVVGMVSVNASSGDVFPHTWHGDFIEMAESHAE